MKSLKTIPVNNRIHLDYYPFGMQEPGRNFSSTTYDFGYQGSLKDDEIKGSGNSYSTMFRELDSRINQWWSLDPKPSASWSPYVSMNDNPIWMNDVLGDKTGFGSDDDKTYVMQFVNKRNEDGTKNNMFDRRFAKKYRKLEKSDKLYLFENIKYDPGNGIGGVTRQDPNDVNTFHINYMIGLQSHLQLDALSGMSPFGSLWEETYHAWDIDKGGYHGSAYDEAQAWKFAAVAPGVKYTINTNENGHVYTDYTIMWRIRVSNAMDVARMLKFGSPTLIFHDGSGSKAAEVRPYYSNLPLK